MYRIFCLIALCTVLSGNAKAQQYRVIGKKPTGDTTIIYRNGQKETFAYVQVMPEPEYDLEVFIRSHINCPPGVDTVHNKQVDVRFLVRKDGSIDSVHVRWAKTNPILKSEAIRVIKTMPPWQPGQQNGEAVNVWYTVPVDFRAKNCGQ